VTPTILVPFPGGVQLEFIYSLGGKVGTNRIWLYNPDEDTTQALLDAMLPDAVSFWVGSLMPLLSADLRLELVRAASWDNPLSPLVSFATPLVNGGAAASAHSANVAIRVTFQPPINVNMKGGGNFVFGIPEDQVDVNTYSSELQGGLFDHYVALLDATRTWGGENRWIWCCVSLVHHNALRSQMFFREVIGPLFSSRFVTAQRKRLR
jgi:hypothetical protein